jgi:hypothetical protein
MTNQYEDPEPIGWQEAMAILSCLGHVARIHRRIRKELVVPLWNL